MSGNTRNNLIQNEKIHLNIGVALVDEKMRESCLRWFIHVQKRAINGLVGKLDLI